jgi:hypothetical protein
MIMDRLTSGKLKSSWIGVVDCAESVNPLGLGLSTVRKAPIQEDWACQLSGKLQSKRIGLVNCPESSNPGGLDSSTVRKAPIQEDWTRQLSGKLQSTRIDPARGSERRFAILLESKQEIFYQTIKLECYEHND